MRAAVVLLRCLMPTVEPKLDSVIVGKPIWCSRGPIGLHDLITCPAFCRRLPVHGPCSGYLGIVADQELPGREVNPEMHAIVWPCCNLALLVHVERYGPNGTHTFDQWGGCMRRTIKR